MTIVMVTHAPEVARHAHRIIEMKDGAIVGPDAPRHVDVSVAEAHG
jgi:ABC-type lipoprotein export system ATPase subunit